MKEYWRAFTSNPVAVKELRARMRGRRAFVYLTIYLTAMALLVGLAFLAVVAAYGGTDLGTPRSLGQTTMALVLAVQMLMIGTLAPALSAGSIVGEKERKSYELLRTTLLSAHAYVFGKLLSSMSFLTLLTLAAVPLQSIALFLGGVGLAEIVVAQVALLSAALCYSTFGLYASARERSTVLATVVAFGVLMAINIFVPGLILMLTGFSDLPIFEEIASAGPIVLGAVILPVNVIASLSLPFSLFASAALLEYEQTFFLYSTTISGTAVTFISPWLSMVVAYLAISVGLYFATVRRVRAIPDE